MTWKDPAAKRAYMRAYRLANRAAIRLTRDPEKVREAGRRYRANHPERVRAQEARYREKHRAKRLAIHRAYLPGYRAKHPEKKRAADAAYDKAHPERCVAKSQRRRAAKLAAPINNLSHAQWLEIQEVQDHRCAHCKRRCKGRLTQDHISPVGPQGSHTLHNVIGVCRSCNSKKGRKPSPVLVQPLLLTLAAPRGA